MKFDNTAQAKAAVVILERAKSTLPKKSLDGEVSPYICDNITRSCSNNLEYKIADELKSWISEMLEDQFSLEEWICQTQGVSINRYSEKDVKKLQTTRHAWVSWMIREIKRVNNI